MDLFELSTWKTWITILIFGAGFISAIYWIFFQILLTHTYHAVKTSHCLDWLILEKNQSKVGRRWRLKLIALRRLKLKEECKFKQNSSFSGWLYCPEEILKDTNVKKSFSWRLRKPMLCSYYGENLWKVVQEQKLNANAYEDGDLGKSILLLSWLWFSLIICLYSNSLYK